MSGVSVRQLNGIARFNYKFYLNVAAHTIVKADPSLRYSYAAKTLRNQKKKKTTKKKNNNQPSLPLPRSAGEIDVEEWKNPQFYTKQEKQQGATQVASIQLNTYCRKKTKNKKQKTQNKTPPKKNHTHTHTHTQNPALWVDCRDLGAFRRSQQFPISFPLRTEPQCSNRPIYTLCTGYQQLPQG